MAQMTGKQFIETFFIAQVEQVISTIPYMAFIIMGIGIEFLGKCLHSKDIMDDSRSRIRFEEAIVNLKSFSTYIPLIGKNNKFDLYSSLRCGLVHSAAPKYSITLSSKTEGPHLEQDAKGERINLRCEDFYSDFRKACEEVIQMPDPVATKLAQPFLEV